MAVKTTRVLDNTAFVSATSSKPKVSEATADLTFKMLEKASVSGLSTFHGFQNNTNEVGGITAVRTFFQVCENKDKVLKRLMISMKGEMILPAVQIFLL